MRQIMRSSLDYVAFAQLCERSPVTRKIMRVHNRIIPRSLLHSTTETADVKKGDIAISQYSLPGDWPSGIF